MALGQPGCARAWVRPGFSLFRLGDWHRLCAVADHTGRGFGGTTTRAIIERTLEAGTGPTSRFGSAIFFWVIARCYVRLRSLTSFIGGDDALSDANDTGLQAFAEAIKRRLNRTAPVELKPVLGCYCIKHNGKYRSHTYNLTAHYKLCARRLRDPAHVVRGQLLPQTSAG